MQLFFKLRKVGDYYAFDAGIPAWANAYPADTLLVGKVITDPEKQLIPKSELKKVTVDFETFKKKAAEANAYVIDARDPIQRGEKLPGFEKAVNIPLDKLIKNIVNQERMKDKQLLIFDQVGKQVRWLMYYLEDKGYKDYYFLKGGATAVLKDQKYRK
jgi:rhodanese-related sulfurtransferase